MSQIKIIIVSLTMLFIVGCATIPSRPVAFNKNLTRSAREKQLSAIRHWNIRGAMSIKANNQAIMIYYHWQQIDSTHYIIQLFGPLGIGAITVTGSKHQVTLTNSKNQSFTAENPETLIENELGFQIPISNLYYWIRGLSVPNTTAEYQWDKFNHLTQIKRADWTIQFLQYTGINQIDLPCQIIITSKTLFAKIIVTKIY